MSKSVEPEKLASSRRQLLKWGLFAGVGGAGALVTFNHLRSIKSQSPVVIPSSAHPGVLDGQAPTPLTMLRDFDYGTVTQANTFITWNLNGRVPGPTFRATEGDRIRVVFYNRAGHSHSLHFHGVHPAEMDGVKPIRNGSVMIYEFDAEPYGVHLYHCHVAPVTRHVGKGLYGMFIIDPPEPRPPADEMLLIMAGYDVNDDKKNELYAFNGLPHYYMHHPIPIQQNQLIRLYVLNMIELDAAVTFHLHANMFKVNRTGRSLQPSEETDVITMGTAERHILEFSYRYPGKYMFHPHQDAIAEAGCMGLFEVVESIKT
jgi:manganese oxidase